MNVSEKELEIKFWRNEKGGRIVTATFDGESVNVTIHINQEQLLWADVETADGTLQTFNVAFENADV